MCEIWILSKHLNVKGRFLIDPRCKHECVVILCASVFVLLKLETCTVDPCLLPDNSWDIFQPTCYPEQHRVDAGNKWIDLCFSLTRHVYQLHVSLMN